MSETFTKLYQSITRSSIWLEDDQTVRVWVTMLALADRNGYVGASVGGLAAIARVPREKTEEALAKFLAPDPDSRSPDFDGRRIEVADRGWILLNYDRFRDLRDEEAVREHERNRKREQRAARRAAKAAAASAASQGVPGCPGLSQDVPPCHANAEAESNAEAAERAPGGAPPLPEPTESVDSRAAAMAWHLALGKPGGSPGAMHAEHAWRQDFEAIAGACNAESAPQLALEAVCEWFWLAPDGPVQAGRVERRAATPRQLAKHVSRDLDAACAWWSQRQEAAK